MKQVRFKQAIELLGYNIVKFSRCYNFRTAFASDRKGDLYYFYIGDLRDSSPLVYYRTAKDTKDYTGGMNRFDLIDRLADIGYEIREPRAKCDYNSL